MEEDDGFWHHHVLPDPDVVEQGQLLELDGHVDDGNVCIVELVQALDFPKVELFEADQGQLCLDAGEGG